MEVMLAVGGRIYVGWVELIVDDRFVAVGHVVYEVNIGSVGQPFEC
jgi:hypothetical protein